MIMSSEKRKRRSAPEKENETNVLIEIKGARGAFFIRNEEWVRTASRGFENLELRT